MISIITPGPLAIIAGALDLRLQSAFPPSLFVHDFMPPKVTPGVWKELTRRTPFIGLSWDDLADATNRRMFDGKSRWTVFLATKNLSGPRSRYFGDSRAPGLFSLVEAATALLHGFTIGGCGSVSVVRASNVYVEGFADDDMAICSLEIEVGTTLSVGTVLTSIGAEPGSGANPTQPQTVIPPGDFNTLSIEWDAASWPTGSTALFNETDIIVRTA